jgi:hypothetical protein
MKISFQQNASMHYMTPPLSWNAPLPLSVTLRMNVVRIWKSIARQLHLVKGVFSTVSKSTTNK